ncbi:MAG TPA: TonB-dependent receptor plug domain-containing protein [Cyclobacteriaceae bacterium]|nr:TonB-dependent receptor plug domain-containing protein [Cyclobacteriaceae bacterium]
MLKLFKFVFVGFIVSLIGMACLKPIDGTLTMILQKLKVYQQYRPQQKIYVHLDKPFYGVGEDIWFSTYLVNAAFNTPDSINKVVYVELFNAEKKMLQQRALYSPNGISHGDFHLEENLPSGNYVIRAYTSYMKNFDEDFFFVKEVTVLRNDDTTPQVLQSNQSIDIQFFPEGGNFLTGAENRIAFKATDNYGRGVDFQGEILDENNTVITTFSSEHLGMGLLRITPLYGKRYHARIKNNVEFPLPEVVQKSYLLKTMDIGPFIKVIAYSDRKNFSKDPLPVYVVAQSNGVASFAAQGEIASSSVIINIPKSKLSSGITQITLLDGHGVPQCERLVFINHQDVLKFKIAQDTAFYTKRKKVTLDVHVSTNEGSSAQGYFSMSVYDETKITDKEKYPISIVSQLLLASDLKGRIEEPGYYFKDTTATTKLHADLLMMTQGWRRFTWKEVLADTLKPVNYYLEQGIVIRGKLLKTITNKPAKNSELKIMTSNSDLLVIKTDSLGRFYTDNLVYFDSTELFIQTDNARGKQADLKFQLDPFNPSTPLHVITLPTELPDAMAFLEQTKIINQIAEGYKKEGEATVLKAVEVKATKEELSSTTKLYGTADVTINMKDMPSTGYINILQVLQGRVAGVSVMGNPPTVSIRGGGEPLFLLNGMQVDYTMISNIPVNDVESIDVLKGASASIYGGRGGNGVIAIYTKKGGYTTRPAIGIHNLKYPGFYKAREFYSPKYDVAEGNEKVPDIRNTLYWNPSIKTDKNGNVKISFFTSDVSAEYKVVMEGISKNGIAGTGIHHFIVK